MSSTEDTAHANNLEYTLKELQRSIRSHEQELAKLRASHRETPLSPIAQVQVITKAFETVANSEPFLPFPDSVLPSLIALRKTHAVITESNALIEEQSASQEAESKQLESDRAALKDQNLIHEALTARIQSLQADLSTSADVGHEEAVNEKKAELERKAKAYKAQRRELMVNLMGFMKRGLVPLLAAEEMGGPVVGDLMDIDASDLAAGFTAEGRLKKTSKGDSGRDKGQRRIDEIWGSGRRVGNRSNPDSSRQNQSRRQTNDMEAVGAEMRWLTEELLNKVSAAGGNTEDAYVSISRESAAVRFLIRSKVAQYHPRDISRIRSIDFGRELEE